MQIWPVCNKGITQFYLSPTHEPYLPLLLSRKASPPLYCLVTEAHRCEKLAQSFYAACPAKSLTHDLLIASPTLYRHTMTPPCRLFSGCSSKRYCDITREELPPDMRRTHHRYVHSCCRQSYWTEPWQLGTWRPASPLCPTLCMSYQHQLHRMQTLKHTWLCK